ncbi:MAG: hypothetical protein ISS46_01290 [Candidatus Omnitrophica bacterium]|nr:hypothetical protein [Candidatus Omnitrophota bacterium]
MEEFYRITKQIDTLILQKPSKDSTGKLLRIIKSDKSCERYFFKNIQIVDFFYPLKDNGYFSPDKAPSPELAEQKGRFIALEWNVLLYLEKVSQQVAVKGNEKYADELLNIINNVTQYHIENNRKLDNYRTWWYFVKILINIPNDKIVKYLKEHKIRIGKDWIKEWITSKFDNMLPSTDTATKLLPKFLTDEKDDIDIAEQIIKVITDIKEEFFEEEVPPKAGLSENRKEPKTVVDSYWLIESFKKNARKIGELCSENVIYDIANKLKRIFNKEGQEHQVLIELSEATYRISAKRVEDFNFEVSIELLRKDEIDALKPEDKYFGVLGVSGDLLHKFPAPDIHIEEKFIQRLREEISKNDKVFFLSESADVNLDKKIRSLYMQLHSDYSYIWFKSLSSGPDVGIHEAKELLTFILRDVLIAKCKSNTETGMAILDKFMGKEYYFPLFRRMVLFVVNDEWNKYKDLFWGFLKRNPETFDESDYEVELYKLLQQNVAQFEPDEKEKIKVLISRGPRWKPDEKQEHYIAYWKQKWYLAMVKDSYFAPLFEKQKDITKIKEIEPPDEGRVSVRTGEGPSPVSKEDILKMSNRELAKYLHEFKTKDKWKGPTAGGLAEVLKAAVKEKPDKFVEDLDPFLKVNYHYAYTILYGLEDVWKEKKTFDWGKLFKFVKGYFNEPGFWEDAKKSQDEDWRDTHLSIINVAADLIQEGTRNDSWAFAADKEYFRQAEEILDKAIEKLPVVGVQKPPRDFATYSLNTSYGRVIIAIILLSLRKARVEDKKGVKKEEIKWNPGKYENLFQKEVIEAYTFFGWYMPNFAYLNKTWVEKKIKEFKDLPGDNIKWQAFMEGYLSGHRVYQDLYKLMRPHYIKAIESDFGKELTAEGIVQHITIGYLRGDESLEGEDSLFKKIIDKWKCPQILEIVSFFWSESRNLIKKSDTEKETEGDKKARDRIIEFWRWIYREKDMIKRNLKDDYKKLLSDLSRLTVILDSIDSENSKWLLDLAPCVEENFNAGFFVEYLNKFDGQSMGFISKIFLEMLTAATPRYKEEDIISIVKKIYDSGNKTDADKICNIYGSKGYEFLRGVYEDANKKE